MNKMRIIHATAGDKEENRARLIEDLRRARRADPGYRVIDIGGRHNPWADEVVDAYADIFEFETDKKLYVGDINDIDIWETMAKDGPFDFAICSHVLEDIRDPLTGLRWLPRVARAGFLGLPNKHTEFSPVASQYWLGQPHHRWVFTVKDDGEGPPGHAGQYLLAIPKWGSVEYFNHFRAAPEADGTEEAFGSRQLSWFEPALASKDNELGVRWEGEIPLKTIDYTLDLEWQVGLYRDLLATGI